MPQNPEQNNQQPKPEQEKVSVGGVGLKEHKTLAGMPGPKKHGIAQKPHAKKLHTVGAVQHFLDRLLCIWVVFAWRVKRAAQRGFHRFVRRMNRLAWVRQAAGITYLFGFWTEYVVYEAWRCLCIAARWTAEHIAAFSAENLRPPLLAALAFLNDMMQPVVQCVAGVRKIHRARRRQLVTAQGEPVKIDFEFFRSGLANYLPVLGRGVACFLPFIAFGFFCYTIHTVLSYQYVLAVQVNGTTVGYVDTEQVFDEAKADLRQRITSAQEAVSTDSGKSNRDFNINPTFMLRVYSGQTMTEGSMADAILRASSDQIQEATALYVEGTLRAVTTEGDNLRAYLENIRAPYEDPDNPNLRVEFVRSIQLVDGVYFTDSITDYDDITAMLSGKEQEQKLYVVQSGDTPWVIAANNDLTLNELYDMNPEMSQAGYNMYVGDSLVVAQEVDFLQVKQIATSTWQEPIAHEKITTESDEYDWGVTKTTVQGSDGLKEVTADITYINGVQTDVNILNETVLVEPVTEEVVKGTHLKTGMVGTYGSGSFIWPVPNYKYVSRWMSSYHNGADICAAYGTPIIASDSGVVVTSTYHYSYGNYVVIDHGNGYRTLYAHMSQRACSVGQGVSQGQIIGYVGSTGNSTGNHCHFEMYQNGVRFSARAVFGGM